MLLNKRLNSGGSLWRYNEAPNGFEQIGFCKCLLSAEKKDVYFFSSSSSFFGSSLSSCSTILLLLNEDAHEVEVVDNEGVERQLYHYIKGKS